MILTRRSLLTSAAVLAGSGTALGGYAFAWEPRHIGVSRYAVTPPDWPADLRLKIAMLADFHVCEPWLGASALEWIVDQTNALEPDVVALVGDYVPGQRISRYSTLISRRDIGRILGGLKAKLGVYGVLGNHDWWEEPDVQQARRGPPDMFRQLEAGGVHMLENDAVRLKAGAREFWLAGLGDQWALWGPRRGQERYTLPRYGFIGVDDLAGTLAKVTADVPLILMAHEPDIFAELPARVSLTLSGHTHGGQVQVMGFAPYVPSMYGTRYRYGHIVEGGRHLIVTSGLGCSGLPVRFGAPPEIVLIELGGRNGVA